MNRLSIAILVAVGGAVGSLLHELLLVMVGEWPDGFPTDILALGLAFGQRTRGFLDESANILLGTGVMGGLSTFSSIVLAVVQLLEAAGAQAVFGLLYLIASLAFGFAAVMIGLRLGGAGAPPTGPDP